MRISQFQRYSQKENTVTNNVLLMLSRVNDLKVDYFKTLIEKLSDGEQEYYPQPNFLQQVSSNKGIIDGFIEVVASKIVIETKLAQKELISKLTKYGEVFRKNSQNQLWHLSSKKYNDREVDKIKSKLKEQYSGIPIQFNNLTFLDLIENLEQVFEENDHDYELKLLFEDFRDYCYEARLIRDSSFKLLFVPTGFSYDWNMKHKIYFCPVNWHKQEFTYFGIYNDKSIRSISKIEAKVVADFDFDNKELNLFSKDITDRQKERLLNALIDLGESQSGLKYYILPEDEFYKINFQKKSKGGIQGHRYKDLKAYFTEEDIKSERINTELIASSLNGKIWY